MIRPVERRHIQPLPEEQSRHAVEAAAARAEAEATSEALKPAKRAALAIGPPLRDIEAAVECRCSCHPSPGRPDAHGAGQTCRCQQTEAERKVAVAELFSFFERDGEAEQEHEEQFATELQAEAVRLGVAARVKLAAAPFVITGVCDGRAFYLRERHGSWTVTIASDDDPLCDPWGWPHDGTTIDIASGEADEFNDAEGHFSHSVALQIAVRAVRDALLRNTCRHETPESPEHRYCGRCGVALADAALWVWSSTSSDR